MVKLIYNKLEHKAFYLWSGLLAVLLGIEIGATILIPHVKEILFNGIENKSHDDFISGLIWFAIVIGIFCVCQGFKYYTGHRVGLIIRTSVVKSLKGLWTRDLKKNYYYDNPDQRIAEDSRLATESAIEVTIEILISSAIIVGLVITMWGDWLLLGLSFGYTAIVCLLALLFHRPMINAEKVLQRAEADFRFKLMSIIVNKVDHCIRYKYNKVIGKYLYYIKVLMGFTLFNKITGNLMSIVPFLVLVPLYFSNEITFGAIMKGVSQFDLIVVNATILILMYPKFTKALASIERLKEFYNGVK